MKSFDIFPIGYVHSTLEERYDASRQRWEDAPEKREQDGQDRLAQRWSTNPG